MTRWMEPVAIGMSEEELRAAFPSILWDEPVPVQTPGAGGLACRYCIAMVGLNSKEVAGLPKTEEEHRRHLAEVHRVAGSA